MDPTFQLRDRDYRFTPLGGPLDQEPRSALFDQLGYAITAFARMEHMVTALAIHLNKEEASRELYEADPLAKFAGLLRLVRKWITRHPAYSHLTAPDDAVLFNGLLEDAGLRNEFAHSFLDSIDTVTGAFTMVRLKRVDKGTWQPITTTYAPEAPNVLARHANLATRHFVEIAKLVFESTPNG